MLNASLTEKLSTNSGWRRRKLNVDKEDFFWKGMFHCAALLDSAVDSKNCSNINAKCKSHRKMVPGSRQDKSSSNPSQKREICLTKKNSLQRENHKIKYTPQIYFKYKSQINFTSAELLNLFSTRSKKSGAVQGGQWLRFS